MDHLQNIMHSDLVCEDGIQATHVIAGITYGCDAVLNVNSQSDLESQTTAAGVSNGSAAHALDNASSIKEITSVVSSQPRSIEHDVTERAQDALELCPQQGNSHNRHAMSPSEPIAPDQDDVRSKLSATIQQVKGANKDTNISIRYYGDALLDNVQNLEEISNPDLVIQELYDKSQEKPIPKMLKLAPLSYFASDKNRSKMFAGKVFKVPDNISKEITNIAQDIQSLKGRTAATQTSVKGLKGMDVYDDYFRKLETGICGFETEFKERLGNSLPKFRECGEKAELQSLLRKTRKSPSYHSFKIMLDRLDDCINLCISYTDKLEHIIGLQEKRHFNEREIKLKLCFEHFLPPWEKFKDDEMNSTSSIMKFELSRTVGIFERMVQVQLQDCSASFEFASAKHCPQPAQIILLHRGRPMEGIDCEIKPLIEIPSLEVKDRKINLGLLDKVREVAKDSCRVICYDMEGNQRILWIDWNCKSDLKLDKRLVGSRKYGVIFAKQDKGFWFPLHYKVIPLSFLSTEPCSKEAQRTEERRVGKGGGCECG